MGKTTFLKIIYFDEAFVADFLQIIAGGELKKTTEFISEVNSELNAGGEASVNVDASKTGLPKLFSLFSGLSFGAKGEVGADVSRKKDAIAKNILENTLLSDFIAILEADEKRTKNKRCDGITVFHETTVRPEVNSFSYLMLIAPYMDIIDGKLPLSSNNQGIAIDLQKMEQAIDRGRGYYEFVCVKDGQETILRFNHSAFRNSYTMSDLPKMQLTYYAIKVGEIDKQDLQVQKEFEFGTVNTTKRIEYSQADQEEIGQKLPVYDVVLAGVVQSK